MIHFTKANEAQDHCLKNLLNIGKVHENFLQLARLIIIRTKCCSTLKNSLQHLVHPSDSLMTRRTRPRPPQHPIQLKTCQLLTPSTFAKIFVLITATSIFANQNGVALSTERVIPPLCRFPGCSDSRS